VIIKPDGMERDLSGQIISRITDSGLKISEQKDIYISMDQAERLYHEHKGKPFYNGVIEYMMSNKVEVLKVEGDDAVKKIRELMGPTDPKIAPAGTVRGDFRLDNHGKNVIINTIHGSDSVESAKRELAIFFEIQ